MAAAELKPIGNIVFGADVVKLKWILNDHIETLMNDGNLFVRKKKDDLFI